MVKNPTWLLCFIFILGCQTKPKTPLNLDMVKLDYVEDIPFLMLKYDVDSLLYILESGEIPFLLAPSGQDSEIGDTVHRFKRLSNQNKVAAFVGGEKPVIVQCFDKNLIPEGYYHWSFKDSTIHKWNIIGDTVIRESDNGEVIKYLFKNGRLLKKLRNTSVGKFSSTKYTFNSEGQLIQTDWKKLHNLLHSGPGNSTTKYYWESSELKMTITEDDSGITAINKYEQGLPVSISIQNKERGNGFKLSIVSF